MMECIYCKQPMPCACVGLDALGYCEECGHTKETCVCIEDEENPE